MAAGNIWHGINIICALRAGLRKAVGLAAAGATRRWKVCVARHNLSGNWGPQYEIACIRIIPLLARRKGLGWVRMTTLILQKNHVDEEEQCSRDTMPGSDDSIYETLVRKSKGGGLNRAHIEQPALFYHQEQGWSSTCRDPLFFFFFVHRLLAFQVPESPRRQAKELPAVLIKADHNLGLRLL